MEIQNLKKLTPTLLGLVLDENCYDLELKPKIGFQQRLFFRWQNREDYINIDTLTRLMKEWCWEQGYQIRSSYKSAQFNEAYAEVITRHTIDKDGEIHQLVTNQGANTEFEAVLKCTHYIMSEKGLI